MHKLKSCYKKAFTPITIMLIPHSSRRSLSLKVPSIGIMMSIVLWCIGMVYVFSVAINALEYNAMKQRLAYYSGQFSDLRATIDNLHRTEVEFKKLFSMKSKEDILRNYSESDSGSTDLETLKQEIKKSMETAGEIKDYLSQQKDLFVSTPQGMPAYGHITSSFGQRIHPLTGKPDFHSGIDISDEPGKPIRATADGIVSFAGWSGGNGNLVVIEHGFKYSTFYAHNKMVVVRVGQKIKRGDIVGYVGSTGNSTGPHVHYEVWQDGHPLDPVKFLNGRS